MSSASVLIQDTRTRAGLSRRALARRAGVPISTVSRVESGEVDPTLTMLQRMVAATGRTLSLRVDAVSDRPSLSALSTAWARSPAGPKTNWTRLRGFLDWLHLHPDELEAAISQPPPRSGNPQLDNLLAAIAEKLTDDAGLARPRWCAAVPPLPEAWRLPGTRRMIEQTERATPFQFKKRNVWLATRDLWRDRA